MNEQHVFPLGWHLHVAAGRNESHVGSTSGLDAHGCCLKFPGVPVLRNMVAAVV